MPMGAYAPGVSAPQPLGLLPADLVPLLRWLSSHPKNAGFDIAELCPRYDRGSLTAKLAAQLLANVLAVGCLPLREGERDL